MPSRRLHHCLEKAAQAQAKADACHGEYRDAWAEIEASWRALARVLEYDKAPSDDCFVALEQQAQDSSHVLESLLVRYPIGHQR